ncbi:hypothetical protein OS242_19760 [Tumebacillus sp. DT12]|uniref:GlsB/YeaQ/YmgE family stress response membrane protein n=1 Tax=Tumebacillus lacus TaxID=2995335 RepID=A0ABT3XBM4_9BACL|nr:hypothetical protein [Tumebacillus lacus]MCX7572164.1 hypothetical protein [Tumebacillus lacus]
MSPLFQLFTWGLSLVAAGIVTTLMRVNRLWGIIFGAILAQGLMFVGTHLLGISFGPVVEIGGTYTPVLVNVVFAVVGALLGGALARIVSRRR